MLNVIAEGIPQFGISFCGRGNQNQFTVGVCVTNPDGTPVTGLTKANFNVFQVAGLLTGVLVESAEKPPFIGADGYYGLGVLPGALWSDGSYIFGIVVSGPDAVSVGRALFTLKIG